MIAAKIKSSFIKIKYNIYMKFIFSGLFAFVTFATAISQTAFNTAKADSLMDLLEKNNKVMGSVQVRQNGQTVYAKSIGIRATENGNRLPNTADTKFRVGSISKMFTSVMVFRLVEEGKLSLGTPLSQFFPQVRNADKITITNLLTHSSGLHNFTDDKEYAKWEQQPQTHEQMLARIKKMKPEFNPGGRYEYSNTNYVLLGYILEKVTGKTYAELLQEYVAAALGLKNTGYGAAARPDKNEARSFEWKDNAWTLLPETDMSIPHGAGSVVSTPADLGVFLESLFAEKIIKKSSLDTMTHIVMNYGYGIFKYPFNLKSAYGHSGGIDGFQSFAAYFPQEKVTFTCCYNGVNYSSNQVSIGLLSILFGEPYTLPNFNFVKVDDDKLARYEGVYVSDKGGLKMTVKKVDGTVSIQLTGQPAGNLDALSETEFVLERYGVKIKFILQGDKPVKEFEFSQRGTQLIFTRQK